MEIDDHPNARRIAEAYVKLDAGDVAGFFDTFDREMRFHFLREIPALTGTYERRRGWIEGVITPMLTVTEGTFAPRPRWLRAAGDELVVAHFVVRFTLAGEPREPEAVLVFRMAEGRIVEAWDILVVSEPGLVEELDEALRAVTAPA